MENLSNRIDVGLVSNEKGYLKWISNQVISPIKNLKII